MRRADRLFRIVQLLRGRRVVTAARLAERLEVSERTIYRDIADLEASGARIVGEAGVGYRLDPNFDLPPLMFGITEIQALVLGARMVEAWADQDLSSAARMALDKIEANLPADRRASLESTHLFALGFHVQPRVRERVGTARRAIEKQLKLKLSYESASEELSERTIQPLGLYFWGGTWSIGAWCELREDYRNFRLDRIRKLELLQARFELESPVTLEEFARAMQREVSQKRTAPPRIAR